MKITRQKIRNFSLSTWLSRKISTADRPFWAAFFASFSALNAIFLFFSAHFMFGDHDWKYIKNGIPLDAGLFEGRFSQFLPINLLTFGDILPIVNNMLGFAGFSLGLALLARYWRLPHTKTAYILFALFTAVTPYILSFMYFAFLVIPVLSWNAFIIGGLLLSEKEISFSWQRTCAAVTLFTLALGGYPPVINLFAVALVGRVLLSSVGETFPIKSFLYTLLNFLLAAVLWKIILHILTLTDTLNPNYYNLQTTPVSEWGGKFWLIAQDIFRQLVITLPFITPVYKGAMLLMTAVAVLSILTAGKEKYESILLSSKTVKLALIIAVFAAGLITLFLSASVKETEFAPRIDFFGLMYAFSAMFALSLKAPKGVMKNITYTVAVFSILYNMHILFEAQKVWKLGFDAEMRFYRRVIKRFEADTAFFPERQYIIVQGGAVSLRPKYYHQPYDIASDDLLDVAYVPGMNSAVMWNFYSREEYADKPAYVYRFQPDEYSLEWIDNASPYPAKESVAVGSYYILLMLTKDGKSLLQKQYPH